MWTCGETPLSKLWPGRTSCFILHRANIQFVSTQLSIQSYFWKALVLFEFIQAQSGVMPNTWGTQKIISPDNNNTSLKYSNYLLVQVPPTILLLPYIFLKLSPGSPLALDLTSQNQNWTTFGRKTKRKRLLLILCTKHDTPWWLPDQIHVHHIFLWILKMEGCIQ